MDIDLSSQPQRAWSSRDSIALLMLIAAAAVMFCSGLSLRSLWGSEGRWAVIAREMMQSGNYFLPTINGSIYFDKPLLSYWAIVPFSLFSGVTEVSARIPGALAGVGTVALVFIIGRNFFGCVSGFFSGLILLTTVMFGFWSRTASAEVLNLAAIWSMLWVMPKNGEKRSFTRYLLFYLIGAVASFCKGPLAPAVAVTTVVVLSCVDLYYDAKQDGAGTLKGRIAYRFHWIMSLKGLMAAVCGLIVFSALLFLPVLVTGSWDAVLLMWRENVLRFVKPFDHVEPFYSYFKHLPVFLLPWTFLAIASLMFMRTWEADWRRRWLAVVAIAIFAFFTLSGSRRSYYILPLVPAFSLIMGRSLAGFMVNAGGKGGAVMKTALAATAFLPLLAGIAMIFGYFRFDEYHHFSQLIVGPAVIISAAVALFFIFRGRPTAGSVITAILFFCIFFWGFTAGSHMAERNRTLKPFAMQARSVLKNVGDGKIAMYGVGNSSFVFYLDRGKPVRTLKDMEEVCAFSGKTYGGYILTEAAFAGSIERTCGGIVFDRVLTQASEGKKHEEDSLILFQVKAKE